MILIAYLEHTALKWAEKTGQGPSCSKGNLKYASKDETYTACIPSHVSSI